MNGSIGTAAGLGVVTGMRSLVGAAAVARSLSERRSPRRFLRRRNGAGGWLADDRVATALMVLAAGEMLADKMPGIPDRIAPGPLLGRSLIASIVGAAVVEPERRALGAAAGAAGAVLGSFAGWALRREVARATLLPDAAIGLAEDAVAVASAEELASRL